MSFPVRTCSSPLVGSARSLLSFARGVATLGLLLALHAGCSVSATVDDDDDDSMGDDDDSMGDDDDSMGNDDDTAGDDDDDTEADCAAFPLLDDGLSPARRLHIAPGGSDESGDGSAGAPFASLQRAASEAGPGDALWLAPGRYAGGIFLSDLAGSAEAPIWIAAADPSEPPVIDATGAAEGLHLIRPRYVVLRGLRVEGASDNGVNIDDGGAYEDEAAAHHVLIDGLSVADIGPSGNRDCLKLSGLRDLTVVHSDFARCGDGGSGLDMVGCHRVRIAHSAFSELGSSGIQAKGGSSDIEIRWSRFVDAGARPINMGGSTGDPYFRPPLDPVGDNAEARDVRVLGNWIEGGETAAAFTGCVDCVFAHNTVIEPGRWGLRILAERVTDENWRFLPPSGGEVVNNLFLYRQGSWSQALNIGPDTDAESFTFAHNLWWAVDDASTTVDLVGSVSGQIEGLDPGLDGDGRVDPAGPAAGAGTAGWLTADATGWCYADPPAIGARALAP